MEDLMDALNEWKQLLQVIRERGVTVEPLDAQALASMGEVFELDQVEELLAEGYPAAPVSVLGMELFPSLDVLLAWRKEDPAWPRRWFPLKGVVKK